MCDVAARCGAEVVRVEAPWGVAIAPHARFAAHPDPKYSIYSIREWHDHFVVAYQLNQA